MSINHFSSIFIIKLTEFLNEDIFSITLHVIIAKETIVSVFQCFCISGIDVVNVKTSIKSRGISGSVVER